MVKIHTIVWTINSFSDPTVLLNTLNKIVLPLVSNGVLAKAFSAHDPKGVSQNSFFGSFLHRAMQSRRAGSEKTVTQLQNYNQIKNEQHIAES
jgi:hypothetical protein